MIDKNIKEHIIIIGTNIREAYDSNDVYTAFDFLKRNGYNILSEEYSYKIGEYTKGNTFNKYYIELNREDIRHIQHRELIRSFVRFHTPDEYRDLDECYIDEIGLEIFFPFEKCKWLVDGFSSMDEVYLTDISCFVELDEGLIRSRLREFNLIG